MTTEQFKKWKKSGNLTFKNQEIYDSLANDLSEGIALSQRNLLELAKYLHLCCIESDNKNQSIKLQALDYALKLQEL